MILYLAWHPSRLFFTASPASSMTKLCVDWETGWVTFQGAMVPSRHITLGRIFKM